MLKQLNNNIQYEIFTELEKIENDPDLYREKNFDVRLEAIDYLEFHIIDRLYALMEGEEAPAGLNSLKAYALDIKSQLEEINKKIFQLFRKKISQDRFRGKMLKNLMDEYFNGNVNAFNHQDITGYDNLDVFLNGILTDHLPPVETKEREPEMVYYQKTPVIIIFALIERAEFKSQDVFFDLGSGLGQVTLLVNLLSCINSKGVEFDPAFHNYAKICAAELHLNDVEFIQSDARYTDYSSGTIFFMYTPFKGGILAYVLQNLQDEAKKRKIKIFTYGPCTREVAKQNWLRKEYGVTYSSGEFCVFHSVCDNLRNLSTQQTIL